MATAKVSGVRVRGIASTVPRHRKTVADDAAVFGADQAQKVSRMTGVQARRVVQNGTITSDLCHRAGSDLLRALDWAPESVDGLFLVTQYPDYVCPATSCTLQDRLGLSKNCAAFDMGLGCSGYVYGLWMAAGLMAGSGLRRVLLLAGDTSSLIVSPEDRSAAPLFGDAGTATALEADPSASPLCFDTGTDGSGKDHLIIKAGGFRHPRTAETRIRTLREDGQVRSDEDVYMNGTEVFAFTLREVPRSVNNALGLRGWSANDVDAFIPHQANQFILEHLRKRAGFPPEKLVVGLTEFGNTSSASIPLAMTTCLRDRLQAQPLNLALSGFGIGLSWASAAVTMGPLIMPELAEID